MQSKLVVVDVVVQDENGNPIVGLKRENFAVEENGVAQRPRSFEPHAASDAPPIGPESPKLPPGSFTNYTPQPLADTLNLLLLDSLNTSLKDQNYLRAQLRSYLNHAPKGQPLAIFALNRQLLMLQGFTSDPAILRAALASKNAVRGSDLLDEPAGTNQDQPATSDLLTQQGTNFAEVLSNVQQFEAETQALNLQLRAQYTLDAMNALAHYLSNFPGRKNIIWFSGSFPLNLLPNPDINNGFNAMNLNGEEFRDTVTMLGNAQAAIYPVDTRGTMSPPPFDAANSGRRYAATATTPSAFGKDIAGFDSSQAEAHTTMQAMADDTGGRAFLGTNDLSGAVAKVVSTGADYYSLAYSPTDADAHGEYRRITVGLVGIPNAARYRLSYRRGYYTSSSSKQADASKASAPTGPGVAYRRIAMSHGAPAPEDIIFRATARPLPGAPEAALAEGDEVAAHTLVKGPYRRIAVQFAALPNAITFAPQPDGQRNASVSFDVYVYAEDGTLLLTNGRELQLHLAPKDYQRVMESVLSMEMTVSVPMARSVFLRMGVEDKPSGRFGVIEVSTRELPAPSTAGEQPASAVHP